MMMKKTPQYFLFSAASDKVFKVNFLSKEIIKTNKKNNVLLIHKIFIQWTQIIIQFKIIMNLFVSLSEK